MPPLAAGYCHDSGNTTAMRGIYEAFACIDSRYLAYPSDAYPITSCFSGYNLKPPVRL